MPEYQAPGVFVEETSFERNLVEGISISIAGFLGQAERGPRRSILGQFWIQINSKLPIGPSDAELRKQVGGIYVIRAFLPHKHEQ